MPTRKTKNVSLTPELERFVAERVACGRYRSASEVVRAALRLLEKDPRASFARSSCLFRRGRMRMNSGLAGKRVLLVEDEVLVAWALEDMLTALGCAVVGPAARVSQALAMIEAEMVDAAVLDVNLNGQKSYRVCSR